MMCWCLILPISLLQKFSLQHFTNTEDCRLVYIKLPEQFISPHPFKLVFVTSPCERKKKSICIIIFKVEQTLIRPLVLQPLLQAKLYSDREGKVRTLVRFLLLFLWPLRTGIEGNLSKEGRDSSNLLFFLKKKSGTTCEAMSGFHPHLLIFFVVTKTGSKENTSQQIELKTQN